MFAVPVSLIASVLMPAAAWGVADPAVVTAPPVPMVEVNSGAPVKAAPATVPVSPAAGDPSAQRPRTGIDLIGPIFGFCDRHPRICYPLGFGDA